MTKREYSRILNGPFEQAFSIPNIKAGFAKCGIYPLNPDAIAEYKMKPSALYCESSCTSSAESDSTQNPASSSVSPNPLIASTPVSGASGSPVAVLGTPVEVSSTLVAVSGTPVSCHHFMCLQFWYCQSSCYCWIYKSRPDGYSYKRCCYVQNAY